MSGDKEYVVKNMVLMEDDLKTEKKYKTTGEIWIFKYPLPEQQRRIARRIAGEFGGLPMDSFTMADRNIIIRDVEINELIEGPDHWQGSDDCLDEDLKNWLFEQSQKWQTDFQEKLKKNKFAKRSAKGKVSD